MKEIPLTQGLIALVDDEDFDELSRWKWTADRHTNTFYAYRRSRTTLENGRSQKIYMHRQITGFSKEVDHRDGDGLNNQRFNLRVCNRQQNSWNQLPQPGHASKFKGVTTCRGSKISPWQAQIHINNKNIYLGLHATEEEAALTYNKKAVELFGAFAKLNIIPENCYGQTA